MTRRTLTSVVAAIAAVAFVASVRAPAADPGMQLSSNDVTASFLPLGLNKSVVVDLESDIGDVLVADPKTVSAVVRSSRRVFIIGAALGQTNVYFFDDKGRQLGALDIAVVNGSPRPPLESNPSGLPANVIVIHRGVTGIAYSCTLQTCIASEKPDTSPFFR